MKALICETCKREYKSQEDFLRDTSRWRFCSEENLWFDCSCGSSNMLLKGEYEWFSYEDVMDKKIATIFSDISETKDIPSIPSSVMKLQQLLLNKKTSAMDIESELKNLPAIAMRTITIANNLKISSSPKITSLQHAISFLGFETISELLLIASLRSFIFKTKKFTDNFFWNNAIMTGKIAEFLIKQFTPHLNNDEAYIAASLCNMGKVVSAICFPDLTDRIHCDIYNTKSSSYVEIEKKHDAISHVILGELAGTMWGLPDYVIYTTALHHTPASEVKSSIDSKDINFVDFAEPEIQKESENKVTLQQVVAFSNQLIHLRTGELFRIDEELLYGYASSLNLAKEDIDDVGEEIKKMDFIPF